MIWHVENYSTVRTRDSQLNAGDQVYGSSYALLSKCMIALKGRLVARFIHLAHCRKQGFFRLVVCFSQSGAVFVGVGATRRRGVITGSRKSSTGSCCGRELACCCARMVSRPPKYSCFGNIHSFRSDVGGRQWSFGVTVAEGKWIRVMRISYVYYKTNGGEKEI